jgi:hypothetical protein
VASDASSASWDWSNDDESIDHDNKTTTFTPSILIMKGNTTTTIPWIICRICRIWLSLVGFNKLGLIDGSTRVWSGTLTISSYNMRVHSKMSV